MHTSRASKYLIILLGASLPPMAEWIERSVYAQGLKRVAEISGINPGACNPGREEKPWLNPNQTTGCRALEVIASMTLEEKLAELGGITGRTANKRLELTSGGGSDGPNGIATMGSGPPQARGPNVTAFANAVTLAATWDRELASRYGKALGEEFIGKGSNSILGPTINIMRTWHWGRNGETFSEDPYVTAEIAVAEIRALNEQRVLTVLKHYVGNNQENSRCGIMPDNAGIDARISDKALHEIYLPAFKAAVERARTGGIMCSFNQVNGRFSCNNPELLGYLRTWGFDGFIAPDAFFALRDALTGALAGVTRVGGRELGTLVEQDKLRESDLDRMLYYNLTPYFRLGIFDSPSKGKPDADVSTPEHQSLARQVAEEGAVLLRNSDNVLPIDPARVKSIAVIGDDAGPHVTIGLNGSGHVYAGKVSIPLDAITSRAGHSVKVTYARGTVGIGQLPAIPDEALRPESGEGVGLLARYFSSADSNGIPVVSRTEPCVQNVSNPPAGFFEALGQPTPLELSAAPKPGPPPTSAASKRAGTPAGAGTPPGAVRSRSVWSARWTGTLIPPSSGGYLFSVTGSGTAQLYVDHKLVATMMRADFGQTMQGTIALEAGRPVPIELKYSNVSSIMGPGLALGWQLPDPEMATKAVAAARQSDVAIVFVAEQMGEGQDKVTLALPGDQDSLIRAIAEANPHTVVVLHTSNPISMPWLDNVAAVIEAFYPGQEAGSSIARLLFGDVNPSGKLAMTFPADESQGPGTFFLDYPGDGMTVNYTEGVLVGYRWYDAKNQEPLFPFGHGLSYTNFRYSDLQVQNVRGQKIEVTVKARITNTGRREGAEVVQLYLGSPVEAEEPPKQLKGFEKIRLEPGQSKVVSMTMDKNNLAAWDTASHVWKVFPGTYSIMMGSSSRDIRLKGTFTIEDRGK
jgi:beta-glucosidase